MSTTMVKLPLGLAFENDIVTAIGRVATVVGQVVAFDITQSDGDVSNSNFSDENSGLGNVIQPVTANLHGWIGVVVQGAAADSKCRVQVRGRVAASCTAGAGGVDPGDPLTAANADDDFVVGTLGTDKIVGIAAGTVAATSTAIIDVDLDGINGWA